MVITARVAAAVIVVCNTEFTIYGVESKKIIRNGKFIVRRGMKFLKVKVKDWFSF